MDEVLEPLLRRADRAYDIPLNVAIWISFKPIIKIYLSIGAGYVLSKCKILTPELSKGISQLILLIFLPCLTFNNIVSEIKDTDIKIFGVVIFSGFIYYVVGLGWGFIVRLFTPIPRAWFGGLLLCCMINNCSDLPLAYVQTIGNSPLLPSDVASKGVSYCVLMAIIFTIFTFNLGGSRLVEWDAMREDPRREEPTVPPVSWGAVKNLCANYAQKVTPKRSNREKNSSDPEQESGSSQSHKGDLEAQNPEDSETFSDHEYHVPYNETDHMAYLSRQETARSQQRVRREHQFGSTEVFFAHARRDSSGSDEIFSDARSGFTISTDGPVAYENLARHMTHMSAVKRTRSRSDSTDTAPDPAASVVSNNTDDAGKPAPAKRSSPWCRFKKRWFKFKGKNRVTAYICNFFEDIFLPQMISLILGVTVAMIPWVRRVFVKGQNIAHFHDAPDQMPPLSFLMDFLKFFAGAQVPLGLMLLGGTIASLHPGKMVPGFWKSLIMIVVFKLAILPIIACAWIHRIREIGWIDKDNPVVPIVLAVSAGTPSATVQIYLTLSWIDPTKNSVELNCLALSLLAQYLFLPITLTILMTYVVMHFV